MEFYRYILVKYFIVEIEGTIMLKKSILYINSNIIIITLGLAMILAILLRFKGLTFQSYWFDELFSARISNPVNNFSFIYEYSTQDVHPPFYNLLLWNWYSIFGYSEYSGRALSAVVGSIGVFTTYLLAKDLYNKEVGVYATLIASTNYFLIYYSQEVRSNELLYLLSSLSYLYFVKLLNQHTAKNLFFYLLFSLLLMYTHYFGFFLVASQVFVFFYCLVKEKEKRKSLLILATISSVIMLLFLSPLFQTIFSHLQTDGYWMARPSPFFFIDYMKAFVLSPFLHKIFLFLFLFVLGYTFVDKRYKRSTIILLIWIIIGFLLPYIKSVIGFSIMIERNMIIILPAAILLVSYGISLLRFNLLKVGLIGIIIFFSLYHLYRMDYYNKVTKDQFRETLQEIIKINKNIPIYDFVYSGKSFKTQANISGININIDSLKSLKLLEKKREIPSCFWVAHGHIDAISNVSLLNLKGMKKIYTIDKFQAQAFLYAYNTKSKYCLKDLNE